MENFVSCKVINNSRTQRETLLGSSITLKGLPARLNTTLTNMCFVVLFTLYNIGYLETHRILAFPSFETHRYIQDYQAWKGIQLFW